MMNIKVIVYTQESCDPCEEEKFWLKENGIDFEERDVRKNFLYFREAINLGGSSTPITLIERSGLKQTVLGFDAIRLKQLLNEE